MFERELQQLGLSDNEAKVYLAALHLGTATMQDIARRAGIPRPTAYVAAEDLMRRGLMSTVTRGKKRYFAAEFPERLLSILNEEAATLKRREGVLTSVLPLLRDLFERAKEQPQVRFFEGKDGLRAMQEDFLRTKSKHLDVIYSLDDVARVFTEEERESYTARRTKKKINVRALYTRGAGPLEKVSSVGDQRRWLPPDHFAISSDVSIYGDRVAIATLKGKLVGVIIESAEMANTMRTIFELAWMAAGQFAPKK